MSIHSWLLFTLIACWLAISEEMSLKSIYLISLNQVSCISFFSSYFVKSSPKLHELVGLVSRREDHVGFLKKILKYLNS
jgi:hypothetical protein